MGGRTRRPMEPIHPVSVSSRLKGLRVRNVAWWFEGISNDGCVVPCVHHRGPWELKSGEGGDFRRG